MAPRRRRRRQRRRKGLAVGAGARALHSSPRQLCASRSKACLVTATARRPGPSSDTPACALLHPRHPARLWRCGSCFRMLASTSSGSSGQWGAGAWAAGPGLGEWCMAGNIVSSATHNPHAEMGPSEFVRCGGAPPLCAPPQMQPCSPGRPSLALLTHCSWREIDASRPEGQHGAGRQPQRSRLRLDPTRRPDPHRRRRRPGLQDVSRQPLVARARCSAAALPACLERDGLRKPCRRLHRRQARGCCPRARSLTCKWAERSARDSG